MTIQPLSLDDYLDLVVAQQASTFRFILCDRDGIDIRQLDVAEDAVPTIDMDTDRQIKRQLSGLTISAGDAANIDPLTMQLRVVQRFPDGTELPWGRFVFTGYDRKRYSYGSVPMPTMVDTSIAWQVGITNTYTPVPGTPISDVMFDVYERFAINGPGIMIEPSTQLVSAQATGWPAGTLVIDVLNALAGLAGYTTAYVDARGTGVLRSAPQLIDVNHADLRYELGQTSRVIADSIVQSDTTLDAPNRYTVTDTSATEAPIFGRFDVPDEAPNSAANIGYVKETKIDAQGAGSEEACVLIAIAAYQQARTYEYVTFATPSDPRHDTYQTCAFDGIVYRETGWTAECIGGGNHTHELRRTYA